METFKFKSTGPSTGFKTDGIYMYFCREGISKLLNIPDGTQAFALKVSTVPVEGYTRLEISMSLDDNSTTLINHQVLYPSAERELGRKYPNTTELWVKPFDIKLFACCSQ